MKKLIIILLILLFALSGCSGYSHEEVGEMREKWDEEYYALEEEYFKEIEYADELETVLSNSEDYILTLYSYFEDGDVSFDEAYGAFNSLEFLLSPYY